MSNEIRITGAVLISALLLVLVSCAGSSAGPAANAQPGQSWLPAVADLPLRSASATKVVDPSLPVSNSAGVSISDPAVAVSAGGNYEYAIYSAAGCGPGSEVESLVFNLDGSVGTVWLGLANFSAQRWEWQAIGEPFSTWMEVALPAEGQFYRASDQVFFFALLVYDGDTFMFRGAHVNTSVAPVLDADNWAFYQLEEGTDWGRHSAACLIDGLPAIVYTDDNRKEIRYAYADSEKPASLSGWSMGTVDDGDNRGGNLSIIEFEDRPCVTFEDTVNQDMYFAYASSTAPTGVASWTSHKPDANATGNGRLATDGSTLMLVYLGIGSLDYAHTITPGLPDTGIPGLDADWESHEIEHGAFYDFPQIAVSGGLPVVAFQLKSGGYNDLTYAYTAGVDGADWDIFSIDATEDNSGNTIRMVLDTLGRPCIAYQNIEITSYLRYARATTATPTSSADFEKITVWQAEHTHVGNWLGLGLYNSRPLMSFVNTGAEAEDGLQAAYATSAAPAGNADFDIARIDEGGSHFVNEETNVLILADGTPAIIYRTSLGLTFALYTAP